MCVVRYGRAITPVASEPTARRLLHPEKSGLATVGSVTSFKPNTPASDSEPEVLIATPSAHCTGSGPPVVNTTFLHFVLCADKYCLDDPRSIRKIAAIKDESSYAPTPLPSWSSQARSTLLHNATPTLPMDLNGKPPRLPPPRLLPS